MTTISIRETDPLDPAVQTLIAALDAYAAALYPAESNHLDPVDELAKEHVYFVGAFEDEQIVGCGAVKRMPEGYGEIKRMYVAPAARGKGIGGQILFALEQHLLAHDLGIARLETGVENTEALGLYRKLGYEITEPFGEYRQDPLSVFLEKRVR